MSDYISRVAAIEELCEQCENLCEGFKEECGDYMLLLHLPAADVREVKHGKWIDMGDFISCSSCNATRLKEFESYYGKAKRLDVRTNFCPNCGADMRGEP